MNIATEKRRMKSLGNKQETRQLNSEFQHQARKDKEEYLYQECQQLEELKEKQETFSKRFEKSVASSQLTWKFS